jgi:hypothetical protein
VPTARAGWITIVRELGVLPMALRTLILVWSLTLPSAKPLDRDAIPARAHDVLACKTSGLSPERGPSRPRAASCDEALWSSSLLAEQDEGDTEDDFQVPSFAIWQARAIHLANALFFPAQSAPTAAHISSGHIPLRC